MENFSIHGHSIPVIIEDKFEHKKLLSGDFTAVKSDEKSVQDYAINGAIYYAQRMITSGHYKEIIAVGVAGDNTENVEIAVYYVFGTSAKSYKYIPNIKNFNFVANIKNFIDFYREKCILTDQDRHEILINSQKDLQNSAKKLNKLMHNHNITAPQRVLYISGMLLSMQDIKNSN